MDTFICKHCGNPSKKPTKNSLVNHERCCPKNLERTYVNGMTGKEPWNKGLTKDTDNRVKQLSEQVSNSTKGKPSRTVWTDEMRIAKSNWRKQLHIDHPEMHPNRRLAGNRNKMSYPERVAYDFISSKSISFEHNKPIDKYFVDFCIGNTVIEIDGARWHNPEKDKIRDSVIESLGYTVYRIDSKERIEERIKSILGVG